MTSNEELQTLNEELQTAKEELQSTNVELFALNRELATRNSELDSANGDLVNILASVEVPIVIVDGARRIRRFTPKARHILNLLPSDVGRPIHDIKPNVSVENLDQKIGAVLDTAELHEEEVRGRDGRWFRLQIRPYMTIDTIDKRIDGAVLSVVDIDVLKRALGAAEWARDQAKATVEAVQVPLVMLNEKLETVSANRAFEATYQAPREADAGRAVQELMSVVLETPAIRSALEPVREKQEGLQGLELDCDLPRVGRRSLSISGRSVTLPDGALLILLALEDVTERRRGEAERANLLREAELAKALAEKANRAKDVFLATLSHELRTPLSSLLLSAQLLRVGELDPAKVRKASDAIERAAREQAQLIDDLLDISRIVTGKLKMELQAVGLQSVAQTALDMIGPTAEKKQIQLEAQLDPMLPPVSGDPVRLLQIVSNLLINAIKFTPERGRVTVIVDAADGQGRIRVLDNGSGIDPGFLPHVFDRFSQADRGEVRGNGGLGLGLAIVRHLVDAHGGAVRAESGGRGEGSSFTISIPFLMKAADAHSDGDHTRAPGENVIGTIKGVRVLLVEDNEGTREALAGMLSLLGATVRAADSAASAMRMFETSTPELLLCDILMPGEDGYSFVRRIRALGPDRGGDVPALALTALASDDDRRRAFAAGFDVHVAKPIDIDKLLLILSRLPKLSVSAPSGDVAVVG